MAQRQKGKFPDIWFFMPLLLCAFAPLRLCAFAPLRLCAILALTLTSTLTLTSNSYAKNLDLSSSCSDISAPGATG
jgi:hypothetical protein